MEGERCPGSEKEPAYGLELNGESERPEAVSLERYECCCKILDLPFAILYHLNRLGSGGFGGGGGGGGEARDSTYTRLFALANTK
jgi:hypothetical protein